MKKILVLLLLMVVSTTVSAEWTEVGGSDNNTAYVDFETIKREGNNVKIWVLENFNTLQVADNDKYLSIVKHSEYDCEEKTSRWLDFYSYSENMGAGEVVYSESNIKEEYHSIIPGSILETELNSACSKK